MEKVCCDCYCSWSASRPSTHAGHSVQQIGKSRRRKKQENHLKGKNSNRINRTREEEDEYEEKDKRGVDLGRSEARAFVSVQILIYAKVENSVEAWGR